MVDFFVSVLRELFHILLLLLHNAIFIAIAAALLYGAFKLGRAGARRLRRSTSPPGAPREETAAMPHGDQARHMEGEPGQDANGPMD